MLNSIASSTTRATLFMAAIGFMTLASSAQASVIILYCEEAGTTAESCSIKTQAALLSLGCSLEISETRCSREEGPRYCELKSTNCSTARFVGFNGESCDDRQRVSISKEHRVHHGYWNGFFGPYSRTICREL